MRTWLRRASSATSRRDARSRRAPSAGCRRRRPRRARRPSVRPAAADAAVDDLVVVVAHVLGQRRAFLMTRTLRVAYEPRRSRRAPRRARRQRRRARLAVDCRPMTTRTCRRRPRRARCFTTSGTLHEMQHVLKPLVGAPELVVRRTRPRPPLPPPPPPPRGQLRPRGARARVAGGDAAGLVAAVAAVVAVVVVVRVGVLRARLRSTVERARGEATLSPASKASLSPTRSLSQCAAATRLDSWRRRRGSITPSTRRELAVLEREHAAPNAPCWKVHRAHWVHQRADAALVDLADELYS